MTLPKFIITMDGYLRMGMVHQHIHGDASDPLIAEIDRGKRRPEQGSPVSTGKTHDGNIFRNIQIVLFCKLIDQTGVRNFVAVKCRRRFG